MANEKQTASKLQQIMTCIFDLACDDLGITSPMKKIVLPYYEAKKGRCFTLEEESRLVKFCTENSGNAASSALLVLLYFGLRKSELASISVEDEKLTCVTSKTRLGRGEVSEPFRLRLYLKGCCRMWTLKGQKPRTYIR